MAKLKHKEDRIAQHLKGYIVISDSLDNDGPSDFDGTNFDSPPAAEAHSSADDRRAKSRQGSGEATLTHII